MKSMIKGTVKFSDGNPTTSFSGCVVQCAFNTTEPILYQKKCETVASPTVFGT